MRQVLKVPAEYFVSPYFPAECIFTGRTAGVTRRVLVLHYVSSWDVFKQILPGMQIFAPLQRTRLDLPVPTTPTPWRRLVSDGLFWAVIYMLLPILAWGAAVGLGLTFDPALQLFVGSLIVGVPLAVLASFWVPRQFVTIRLVSRRGDLELCFPGKHAARAERYRQGFAQYQAAGGTPEAVDANARWRAEHAAAAAWQGAPAPVSSAPSAGGVALALGSPATPAGKPDHRILRVNLDFMNSRFVPPVCLYSGRTDDIQRIGEQIEFRQFPFTHQQAEIYIPQAPGARGWWNVKRNAAGVLFLLGPIGCLFLGLALEKSLGGKVLAGVFVLGGLVSLFVAFGLRAWMRSRQVRYRLYNAQGGLEIDFPAGTEDRFDRFQAAWETWQEARRTGHTDAPPDSRPVADIAADGEESWADRSGDGWDQGKH